MKIPDWAENAIKAHKPLARARAPAGQPNNNAIDLWAAYSARFRQNWNGLKAEKWKVATGSNGTHQKSAILTAALDCARRIGDGGDPLKIVSSRRDLLRLEEEISGLAAQLVQKFEAHEFIQNSTGVGNWRLDSFGLDPLDLWDAMEISFNPGPETGYPHPMCDVWPHLSKALNIARNTSLSIPEWPDLLRPLADRFEFGTLPGEFPDITTNGYTTNKSEYSPWCNSLIAMLHERALLDCLSLSQLSELAMVAFNAIGQTAINSKQIGDLKRTYLKNL